MSKCPQCGYSENPVQQDNLAMHRKAVASVGAKLKGFLQGKSKKKVVGAGTMSAHGKTIGGKSGAVRKGL